MNYLLLHDKIIYRARSRRYDSKIHHNHHVIPKHTTETPHSDVVPLTLKEHYIIHHINYRLYGRWQDRAAWKTLKLGYIDSISAYMMGCCSLDKKIGIHDPNYQHLRKDWAMIGQIALQKSGNRGGCAVVGWADLHKEERLVSCSRGGKIGGIITGSKFWWNDGSQNKRSDVCPGDGWVRGMLMSEKKRTQVECSLIRGRNKNV
jgi:hypothetical protein